MELSPKLLTDIEFREQWRGYSPSEVDEFLERVAAGVGELQQRLAEALERASTAERKLLERSDDDEIRRTLVLAQRTAVQAMEEARADADRLVGEADAQCRQLLAEAQAQAATLEAEIDARRRAELGILAQERASLEDDIARLQSYVDEQRSRLRAALEDQLAGLDRSLTLAPRPLVSDVHVEPPAPAVVEPAAAVEPVAPSEPLVAEPAEPPAAAARAPELDAPPAPAPDAVDDLRQAREELAAALQQAGISPPEQAPPSEPQHAARAPRPLLYDDRTGDDTGEEAGDEAGEPAPTPTPAPAPEPSWRDDHEHDDDPFLAELRRAVVDTEPLGPRDHEPAPPGHAGDEGDDNLASGGFFRRGRRRS